MVLFGAGDVPVLSTAQAVQTRRSAPARQMLAGLSARGVTVVPLAPLFCDTVLPGRCVNARRGVVYYVDDDHPSAQAAGIIARAAVSALMGRQDGPQLAARP